MTDLTDEQREERRTRARDLIEARLTETWPAWRRPGRKPNLTLAADIALDSLGELAAEILVDGTMMRALTFRDGVATLELAEATEMVRIFAAGMRGVLDGNGASNYVEMEMTDGATGQGYTVTVQRRECPTPHQFRQQAEARAEQLAAELEDTRDALAVARQVLGTTTRQPETEADPVEPDHPAAHALATHIADHPVSTIQAACRYLGWRLDFQVSPVRQPETETPAADRRARYAAAIREADGWVLDNGQHMIDAVMAVADTELAALRAELAEEGK
ncbi:hypothetical protein ACFYY2_17520 [Streptomyces sp. NPDC001822]|uniref:hypothetical protein n=1 Tax=Streptomyces sp. NPDC001822 TaxID=3364614 RepID=UPI0036C6438F